MPPKAQPARQPRIYHFPPPPPVPSYYSTKPNALDTSLLERNSSEISDSEWIEVDEEEWSDEALMDDARTGRRKMANGDYQGDGRQRGF